MSLTSQEEEEDGRQEDDDELEEEEEIAVEEVCINGCQYYTTDLNNGEIFSILEGGEIGEVVGKFSGFNIAEFF